MLVLQLTIIIRLLVAMVEPIYEYVKSEGWVATFRRPFPHNNLSTLCNNCNQRAGKHLANTKRCPNPDGWGWADTFWA
jgi:hypothetical protein